MGLVQLNIGSNPCTTRKTLALFLFLNTLTIFPSISFIIFYLCYQSPLITKQVGLDPDSRGLRIYITMREPIAMAVQASTPLPLPFAYAFQFPQYINHFPYVSSLCQSESQHSSTSSPKTLTKKTPPLNSTPTSLSRPLTRILNSDPQWRRILWILSFPLPG